MHMTALAVQFETSHVSVYKVNSEGFLLLIGLNFACVSLVILASIFSVESANFAAGFFDKDLFPLSDRLKARTE